MNLHDVRQALLNAVLGYEQPFHCDSSREDDQEAGERLHTAAVAMLAALEDVFTPEDTCVVGDPDPTPRMLGYYACGAKDPDHPDGLVCTRCRPHAGRQHVAGNCHTVLHVWPWQPTDRAVTLAAAEPS